MTIVSRAKRMEASNIFPATPKRARRSVSMSPSPHSSPHSLKGGKYNELFVNKEPEQVIQVKSFYKSSSSYLNPYERMVQNKPKIFTSLNRSTSIPVKKHTIASNSNSKQKEKPEINKTSKTKRKKPIYMPDSPVFKRRASSNSNKSVTTIDDRFGETESSSQDTDLEEFSEHRKRKPVYVQKSPVCTEKNKEENSFLNMKRCCVQLSPAELLKDLVSSELSPEKSQSIRKRSDKMSAGQENSSSLTSSPEKLQTSPCEGLDKQSSTPGKTQSSPHKKFSTPTRSSPRKTKDEESAIPNKEGISPSSEKTYSEKRFFKNRCSHQISTHLKTVVNTTGLFGDNVQRKFTFPGSKSKNVQSKPKNPKKKAVSKKNSFTKIISKKVQKQPNPEVPLQSPKLTAVKPKAKPGKVFPNTVQTKELEDSIANRVAAWDSGLDFASDTTTQNCNQVVPPTSSDKPSTEQPCSPRRRSPRKGNSAQSAILDDITNSALTPSPRHSPNKKASENTCNVSESGQNLVKSPSRSPRSKNLDVTRSTKEGLMTTHSQSPGNRGINNAAHKVTKENSVSLELSSSLQVSPRRRKLQVTELKETELTVSPRRSPRSKEVSSATDTPKDQKAEKLKSKLFPIFSQSPKASSNIVTKRAASPVKPSIPGKRRKLSLDSSNVEQLIIDAGQKSLGPKTCATCGMLFSTCSDNDVDLHLRHHATFLGNLRFQGWKSENVVGLYPDGRVLLVRPADPSHMIRKIEEVRTIVDRDLGFVEQSLPSSNEAAFLLFVSNEKRVVGCLIADSIREAYELLPPENPSSDAIASFCSETSVPVVCGVSRIWTAPKWRRKKVASRLLDCLRMHFMEAHVLKLSDIAFSAPTMSGQRFAEHYTGRKSFFVYK